MIVMILCIPSGFAWGTLTADQTAVLANRNSPDSLAIAQHYAERRGLKSDHIIVLDLGTDETIGRGHYEQNLIKPLRQALETRNLASRIRCLVTTYGIPLVVVAPQPTDDERRSAKDAAQRQEKALAQLQLIEGSVKRIGVGESPRVPPAPATMGVPPETQKGSAALVQRVAGDIREAVTRMGAMQDRQKAEKLREELVPLIRQFGGHHALLQEFYSIGSANQPQERPRVEQSRQQIATAENLIKVLSSAPSDLHRQSAYRLAQQVFGVRGVLTLAQEESERLSYENGNASLDSELSLLWWDRSDYQVSGRMPNPLFQNQTRTHASRLVVMVARLDAPTPELARRLVDQAMTAEQHGLAGKFYVDAQGLKPNAGSYGFYDQSLRDLAALVRRTTSYEVRLDDTPQRFSQPGQAPDVALYIGWYRLRYYEDAFSFNPGAIGYHIASGEAVSLHEPTELGWCKNALQHGITATLGSIGEPYLDSFPAPKDFVGLLLTGRYSLVEAYYLTSRYVSWRMVLVGDPLYSPWRGKGYTMAEVHPLPIPPSDLTSPDPVKAREQYRTLLQNAPAQADRLMEQMEVKGGQP